MESVVHVPRVVEDPSFRSGKGVLGELKRQERIICFYRIPRAVVFVIRTLAVFLLVFFFFDVSPRSKIGYAFRELGGGALYQLHKRRNDKSAFELFADQNPIFTQELSSAALKKLLADRRRLRGGRFENSLIAACSDNSAVLPTTLASWNRVRGVREIVVVDYDSKREGPLKSLKIVDSIDKLGRILHVTVASRDSSLESPGQWARARALNLGVAVTSGQNIVLVDCNTVVRPEVLSEHRLNNRTFYTGNAPKHSAGGSLGNEVMYMTRRSFEAVHGFDERIDIHGCEYTDLLRSLRKQLRLRRLSMDSQMIQRIPETIEVPSVFGKDVNSFEAEDIIERSRKISELSRHISMLAKEELGSWNGSHADGMSTILRLGGLRFSVLREQIESSRHSRRGLPFRLSKESDYRLWIRASRTSNGPAMLDLLSELSLRKVVLSAHRKLLHDEYNLPWKLLGFVEKFPTRSMPNANFSLSEVDRSSEALEGQIANYSPLLFDVVWQKKRLLVVNVEVGHAMELFVGVSWAVASAISKNRALMLVGHVCGTPIGQLLDFDAMTDVLHREYNLKINIMGGRDPWVCGRDDDRPCWTGDPCAQSWDEYEVIKDPSSMTGNASRHNLFNIVSDRVRKWEGDASATLSQVHLQRQAFASISLSREVGQSLLNTSQALRDNLDDATGLWMSGDSELTKKFAERYMEHHASREGHRPLLFVTGSNAEAINLANETIGSAETTAGPFDAVRRTADLWIMLQCRNIVFDSLAMPAVWTSADAAILEWRRVHSPESPHYGVSHLRPSNGTSSLGFHKLEFDVEPSAGE